jgi:hypothetical protein
MRAASSAEIASPVNNSSIACLGAMFRESATMGVEQNSPIFTPGVAKRAAEEAIARSQLATSWQPAAKAGPCTAAMTGCGRWTTCCIVAAHSRMMWAK